ncbi:C-type natriuretic peptide 2 [Ictalurus furcatus]|uniref:C-type natriuretic peptide 2 n=1 Tax=Ictalurus furcatus TaxID=66913 RepID=UPI002350DB53|nr:C-type natriuretic peptide 2 [Ictalurus furcatus]
MNIAVMFICHLDGNGMECVTSQRWGLKWPLRRQISEQTSLAQDRTQHREDTRLKLQILNHQVVLRLRTFIFKLFILNTSKMASSSSRLFALFLLTAMVTQVMSRPSSRRPDSQILQDLFGSEITSLLLSQLEVTEGSAQSPALSESDRHGLSGRVVMEERLRHVPRPFLDFLTRQRKLRVWNRKGSARGCFGIKVDRIGALSGLGC